MPAGSVGRPPRLTPERDRWTSSRDLVEGVDIQPTAILDILLTALLFYGLFSLIRGTRAVRLVIGAIVLYGVYAVARLLDLRMLSGILETGAVVGLRPWWSSSSRSLRRALERIGRVGSMGWAFAPTGAAGLAERWPDRVPDRSGSRPAADGGAHRHRTGHRPRGHGRDRRDAPRRPVRGAADLHLHAPWGAP